MSVTIAAQAAACLQHLRSHGYAVLEGFLTEDQLEELRLVGGHSMR